MDPTSSSTLYAAGLTSAATYGLYVTHDGANTWQLLTSTSDGDSLPLQLAVDPGTPARLWAARNDGLWVSNDSGATWTATGPNPSGGPAVSAIALNPGNPANLFVGTPAGKVYTSPDGAATWTDVTGNIAAGQIFTLAVNPTQAAALLAGGQAGMWGSATGGTSWSSQVAGLSGTDVMGFTADPTSDRIYLNLGIGGIYSISNGAGMATAVNNSALGQLSSSTSAVFISSFLGVYRSADGGQTWSAANSGMASSTIYSLVVAPTNAQNVYATVGTAAGTALMNSTNGGTSWTALPNAANVDVLAIDPVSPQILYGTGPGSIVRSVDGGTTWETIRDAQTLPAWLVNALFSDPNRTSDLLVATAEAGAQVITIAPDLALQGGNVPSSITVGTAASYSFTVTNNGPFSATGVQVSLQLPTTAQSVVATSSLGTCSISGTTASCAVGVLRNAASATITLTAVASAAGSFAIAASVQAHQPDPNTANNSVTTTATASVATTSGSSTTTSTSSHGGGGAISLQFLLALALLLAMQKGFSGSRAVANGRGVSLF
jgi:uncharacterized repeat protein (TIGR01451 family)